MRHRNPFLGPLPSLLLARAMLFRLRACDFGGNSARGADASGRRANRACPTAISSVLGTGLPQLWAWMFLTPSLGLQQNSVGRIQTNFGWVTSPLSRFRIRRLVFLSVAPPRIPSPWTPRPPRSFPCVALPS